MTESQLFLHACCSNICSFNEGGARGYVMEGMVVQLAMNVSSTRLRRSKRIHVTMHCIEAILLGEREKPTSNHTMFKCYKTIRTLWWWEITLLRVDPHFLLCFIHVIFQDFNNPSCVHCASLFSVDMSKPQILEAKGIAVHCDSLVNQQPPTCWEITKRIISMRRLLTPLSWELFTDQQTEPLHNHKSQARPIALAMPSSDRPLKYATFCNVFNLFLYSVNVQAILFRELRTRTGVVLQIILLSLASLFAACFMLLLK